MSDRAFTDSPAISRLIEKQMRNWEIARAQKLHAGDQADRGLAQFITISNICGAGGNEIATLLGQKLGWPVFDRQILTTMADDDEVRTRLYRSMDERDLTWFEDTFRTLMQAEFSRNDYFHRLSEAILCLARQGPAVFVGRSADLILPREKGLRVKVVASRETCAENFARRANISLEQARSEVERIEADRADFVRHHFNRDPYDPTRFDLLINTERFVTMQIVDFLFCAAKARRIVA